MKNLVIVESPAKAKTIEGFLGKDYVVKSSYGHVRDLSKKENGVIIDKEFEPIYEVPGDKKAVVNELKKDAKSSELVWLATDEDREGEAISWHLKEVLGLENAKIRRIVFHEITKRAITEAIQNPRTIDVNLVEAQQARRILDRLVGFEISPILWRKVRPQLSAGRVQSVAVRLIVEREREIEKFNPESQYRVTALFYLDKDKSDKNVLKAELPKKFKTRQEAEDFLKKCQESLFSIAKLEKKDVKKTPAPPFTTSTLQQEASRKLRFSVAKTMMLAQRLYEAGHITYMRTDSVNLSSFAINASKEEITKKYGEIYSKTRQYKTKSNSAQEAHEAIRPSYFEKESAGSSKDEQALYELIWKRAIASQMSDAQIERNIATIDVSNAKENFQATGEVLKFDGFLKVYLEGTDDENGEDSSASGMLPPLDIGQELFPKEILATERFTRPSPRYTEAALVKKLEELGIGRPSTYAPTISTVQKRGYVLKEERIGTEREYEVLKIDADKKLSSEKKTEITGAEKGKLYPSEIAKLVNDFLIREFPNILDYQFTASVEKDLDEIASGGKIWNKVLGNFYKPFHKQVEDTLENSERVTGERILGKDPESGKTISVRMARFGPVAQKKMNLDDEDEKPEFAGLLKDQTLETITLQEAIDLFKLPRTVGEFEDQEVVAAIGRYGPYLRHDGKFTSIPKEHDPYTIDIDTSIELIKEKRKKDDEKTIKVFDEDQSYKILKGKWGPYLKAGFMNVRIPKDKDAENLTYEECKELVESTKAKKGKTTKETKTKKAAASTKGTKTKKATAKKSTKKKK